MARILVVDDDEDFVDSVTMMLEKKNHIVIPAYGGEEGLEKARNSNPDLIVLDVMMPDKNGYDVCKELKSDPQCQDIPIIMLTAVVEKMSSTTYNPLQAMNVEAEDWIDKPVEPAELAERVERLLSQ